MLADSGATVGQGLLAGVAEACFYRSGVLTLAAPRCARSSLRHLAPPPTRPARRWPSRCGRAGRVVVFADSDLFGDDSIEELDHRTLWTNVVTWAAGAATGPDALAATAVSTAADAVELDEHWLALKDAVTRSGRCSPRTARSTPGPTTGAARRLVDEIPAKIAALAPRFPHDADYLEAVRRLPPLGRQGFGTPDFLDSLVAFRPDQQRVDGLQHLVVFPMYTQNGNLDRNVEACSSRSIWPQWLAELRRAATTTRCSCRSNFVDFTSGYDTNSAVLSRDRRVREVRVPLGRASSPTARPPGSAGSSRPPPRRSGWSCPGRRSGCPPPGLAESTFVLWDLIHDRTHSHGDLPFDPFMIKQRMPFWLSPWRSCAATSPRSARRCGWRRRECVRPMLTCSTRSCSTGCSGSRSPGTGCATTTGSAASCCSPTCTARRAALDRHRLCIDWDRVADGVTDLRREVEELYREGIDRSRPLAAPRDCRETSTGAGSARSQESHARR